MSITLYKFGPVWGVSDPSPFCLKLESYLKMVGADYTAPRFTAKKLNAAPKGKFPYVEFEDGTAMGDSNLIIDELIARGHRDLDETLSSEEKAVSLAFRRLLDENLYWVGLYSRWVEDEGWEIVKPVFFHAMPAMIRNYVANKVRKNTYQRTIGHGIGHHSRDEIYKIAEKDIDALSNYLGKKTFFFGGKKPTLLDVCVYAYTANFLKPPFDSPAKEHLESKKNLVNHYEKMHKLINE